MGTTIITLVPYHFFFCLLLCGLVNKCVYFKRTCIIKEEITLKVSLLGSTQPHLITDKVVRSEVFQHSENRTQLSQD